MTFAQSMQASNNSQPGFPRFWIVLLTSIAETNIGWQINTVAIDHLSCPRQTKIFIDDRLWRWNLIYLKNIFHRIHFEARKWCVIWVSHLRTIEPNRSSKESFLLFNHNAYLTDHHSPLASITTQLHKLLMEAIRTQYFLETLFKVFSLTLLSGRRRTK